MGPQAVDRPDGQMDPQISFVSQAFPHFPDHLPVAHTLQISSNRLDLCLPDGPPTLQIVRMDGPLDRLSQPDSETLSAAREIDRLQANWPARSQAGWLDPKANEKVDPHLDRLSPNRSDPFRQYWLHRPPSP